MGKFDIVEDEEIREEDPPEKFECKFCLREFVNIESHMKRCKDNPANIQKPSVDTSELQMQIDTLTEAFSQMKQLQLENQISKNLLKESLLESFELVKSQLRNDIDKNGNCFRPTQRKIVDSFENKLNKL